MWKKKILCRGWAIPLVGTVFAVTHDRLETILTQVAQVEKIRNYQVIVYTEAIKGDGLLSEFYPGEVINKDTGDIIKTYIKIPPKYKVSVIDDVYINEHQFYGTIFPKLDGFQKEKEVTALFDSVPKFYCGNSDSGTQYLALEDLIAGNYVSHEKVKFFDEEHLKLIFTIYGRFHALGFAFKQKYPECYEKITKPLIDIVPELLNFTSVQVSIENILPQVHDNIKRINEEAAKKIKPYADNAREAFVTSMKYLGKYSTLVHGDCWSNNMLFKYSDNGSVEHVKLIDYQLLRDSTPIHDLSYAFYSSASKNDLAKLDYYLDVYYQSFATKSRELGADPETLFPKEVLKNEWRTYCIWGILMSCYIWQAKFLDKEKIASIKEGGGSIPQQTRQWIMEIWQDEKFQENIQNIFLHAVEYDIL